MPSLLSACSRASLWSCEMTAWDVAASTAFHPVGATAAKWSFWRKLDEEAWSRWRDVWLWIFRNERPTTFSFTLWILPVALTVPMSLSIFLLWGQNIWRSPSNKQESHLTGEKWVIENMVLNKTLNFKEMYRRSSLSKTTGSQSSFPLSSHLSHTPPCALRSW